MPHVSACASISRAAGSMLFTSPIDQLLLQASGCAEAGRVRPQSWS
jgi:hypothetical protein